MKNDKEIVRIELTPEQKQLIKKETGKDAEAVELSVQGTRGANRSRRVPIENSTHDLAERAEDILRPF